MYLALQRRIQDRFVEAVAEAFKLEVKPPALDAPPSLEMGDISLAACFELAKTLRQPPRKIAEQLASRLLPIRGISQVSIAGAGYLNFHLDRALTAIELFQLRTTPQPAPAEPAASSKGKILVEHTSINPNKAAHIGHLRNAVLGDTFTRLLRFGGEQVEVQNYIDNTGVQVADVVVGFVHMEKKSVAEVAKLLEDPAVRFDYYCWDLYARVFNWYETQSEVKQLRLQALQAIEEGHGDLATMAELISTAIVRKHLTTMLRINVEYDLLVQESEILRLKFWQAAFELLKAKGGIHFEESGKNAGCWVMALGDQEDQEASEEDVKIIVRSNGTVTYVGKDIAYHLWKFGLLGKDFGYEPFYRYPDGREIWRTGMESRTGSPQYGRARVAYAVIDARQSYLQNIVKAALETLGYHDQAENLHHFAYEVVGLSARCAEELGVELSEEDRQRPYVEVSGRKGLGVKADDLIDALIAKAFEEVRTRQMTENATEQETNARMIAVAALRYFLLKFSRRVIIAFDLKEALAFEGETGPYLQYSIVRARNIFRKFQEQQPDFKPQCLNQVVNVEQLQKFFRGEEGVAYWELAQGAAQLELAVEQAVLAAEPSVVTKYAFRMAQSFNNFYHRFHILSEEDPARQHFLLYLVYLVSQTLSLALSLLGIEIPERM